MVGQLQTDLFDSFAFTAIYTLQHVFCLIIWADLWLTFRTNLFVFNSNYRVIIWYVWLRCCCSVPLKAMEKKSWKDVAREGILCCHLSNFRKGKE